MGDTRESPAYEVIAGLQRWGAAVSYADPHVPTFRAGECEFKAVEPTERALAEADCVLVLADHPEFDYEKIGQHARLIVDTRQAMPAGASVSARVITL